MKTLFTAFLALCLAVPAYAAEEKIPLFKDVYYGMSKAAVRKGTGALPCEEDILKGQLCRKKPVNFGKQKWGQIFYFDNDKLIFVILFKKLEGKSLQNVMRTIADNGYSVILMYDGTKHIDKLEEWSKGPNNDVDSAMLKFERDSMDANKLTYTLIEDDGIRKAAEKQNHLSRNIQELLENAPRNLRAVEVSRSRKVLLVKFIAPVANIQDNQKNQEEVRDTF